MCKYLQSCIIIYPIYHNSLYGDYNVSGFIVVTILLVDMWDVWSCPLAYELLCASHPTDTTNENWCDDVSKPVPSDLLQSTVTTPPEAEIVEDDSGSGDSVTLLPTPTVSPEPSITHSEPSEGDANGAQSLALPAVFWTFLSAVILIL